MSTGEILTEIDYPESDGKPVGETDVHIGWIFRLRDLLRRRYRGQRVYTAADLLVYYVEGDPRRFIVPDNFVALDCEPGNRRVFKIWEEKRHPDVVIEVTSRKTARQDRVTKPAIFRQIGVQEYFLYDPEARYLRPSLQGFRLINGAYQLIQPVDGVLRCQTLGLDLSLDGRDLVIGDIANGEILLTGEDAAEQAAAKAQQTAAEAIAQARRIAAEAIESQQRIADLEAEVERLKRANR